MPQSRQQRSAEHITAILRTATPIMEKQTRSMTHLDSTDLAAAVYAVIFELLGNNPELASNFIDTTIGQNYDIYETIFRYLFNLGYASAVTDVHTKRIKIR